MATLALPDSRFHSAASVWAGVLSWPSELHRREPVLTAIGLVFLLALVPTLFAASIDTREINGISVWVKPSKFLLSLATYYFTLAWYFGYLTPAFRTTRPGRVIVYGSILVGVAEMVWLLLAAVVGVPSHFNRESIVWSVAYPLAGVGATMLLVCMWLQARGIAASAIAPGGAAMRRAIVWSSYVAVVTTLITAFVLAAGSGHWVGGTASDAGGLPLLGWSQDGGDLRVAHFWALHTHQIVPFVVWLLTRHSLGRDSPWLVAAALVAYGGFIGFTFLQALAGQPFLG